MNIVDPLKFGIGLAFLLVGLAVLWLGRGERGFGQKRQIGGLLIVGAGVFIAVGLVPVVLAIRLSRGAGP